MHKKGLLFLFVLAAYSATAQIIDPSINPYYFRNLYNCLVYRNVCENVTSLALVPEVQRGNNAVALGVARVNYTYNYSSQYITGRQVIINAGYLHDKKMMSVSAAYNLMAIFPAIGAHVGLRAINYINHGKTQMAIRPQAGITYKKLALNYGYDFLLQRNDWGLQQHNITLSYFLHFLPRIKLTTAAYRGYID